MRNTSQLFRELSESPTRNRYRLNSRERQYLVQKGLDCVVDKATYYIREISDASNGRREIPTQGHPACVALHATAVTSRSSLERWHDITKGEPLREEEIDYLVDVVRTWLHRNWDR